MRANGCDRARRPTTIPGCTSGSSFRPSGPAPTRGDPRHRAGGRAARLAHRRSDDHVLVDRGSGEPYGTVFGIQTLAWLGGQMRRVRLMPSVLVVPMRNAGSSRRSWRPWTCSPGAGSSPAWGSGGTSASTATSGWGIASGFGAHTRTRRSGCGGTCGRGRARRSRGGSTGSRTPCSHRPRRGRRTADRRGRAERPRGQAGGIPRRRVRPEPERPRRARRAPAPPARGCGRRRAAGPRDVRPGAGLPRPAAGRGHAGGDPRDAGGYRPGGRRVGVRRARRAVPGPRRDGRRACGRKLERIHADVLAPRLAAPSPPPDSWGAAACAPGRLARRARPGATGLPVRGRPVA